MAAEACSVGRARRASQPVRQPSTNVETPTTLRAQTRLRLKRNATEKDDAGSPHGPLLRESLPPAPCSLSVTQRGGPSDHHTLSSVILRNSRSRSKLDLSGLRGCHRIAPCGDGTLAESGCKPTVTRLRLCLCLCRQKQASNCQQTGQLHAAAESLRILAQSRLASPRSTLGLSAVAKLVRDRCDRASISKEIKRTTCDPVLASSDSVSASLPHPRPIWCRQFVLNCCAVQQDVF